MKRRCAKRLIHFKFFCVAEQGRCLLLCENKRKTSAEGGESREGQLSVFFCSVKTSFGNDFLHGVFAAVTARTVTWVVGLVGGWENADN